MMIKRLNLRQFLVQVFGVLFLFQSSALATYNYELNYMGMDRCWPTSGGNNNNNTQSSNASTNCTAGSRLDTPSPYQQQYAQPGQIYGSNSTNLGGQARFGSAPQQPSGPSAAEIEANRCRAERERQQREAQARREAEERERKIRFEAQKKAAIEHALAEGAKRIEAEDQAARQATEDYFEKERNESLEKVRRECEARLEASREAARELCFPGNTLINIPLLGEQGKHIGSQFVPISSVKVGDWVYSCDLNSLECQPARVSHIFQRKVKKLVEISVQGKTIQATPNHPFYVVNRQEMIPAQDLTPQDLLLDIGGNNLQQDQPIREIEGNFTVYNIEVEGHHTYYAESVLVHNCNAFDSIDLSENGPNADKVAAAKAYIQSFYSNETDSNAPTRATTSATSGLDAVGKAKHPL